METETVIVMNMRDWYDLLFSKQPTEKIKKIVRRTLHN